MRPAGPEPTAAERRSKWLIRGTIAALVLAFLLLRDQLPDFSLEAAIEDLSQSLGSWTYLLVGGLAFLETGAFVGLVAPGEFTVILGGAVAGQGDVSLSLILALTWFSAWAGDTVSFFIGRRLGRQWIVRHGPRIRLNEERLRWVEDYFARHGGWTILVGRFIGIVRAVAPFIAGSSGMRYRAFLPYSILGTGLWATGLILVGYFASQNLHEAADLVGRSLIAFGFTVGAVIAVILGYRHLRDPGNRRRIAAAMERRPYLRPLLLVGRRVQPQARFVADRFIPGGLGLELTSLLAIASVGLFVLIAYTGIVSADSGPTPGDEQALDVADAISAGWLEAFAKAVTELGSLYVILPLAALAGGALAWTRHWMELGVLVAGFILTVVAAHEIKLAVDRPRPPDGLVDVSGSSFPSRHAAYASLWAWLAVTLAVRVAPGLAARGAVVAAGIAVAALVGLSRVYLKVHFLSDVSAGWGLGAAAFALCGAVAVVITYLRQNGARHGSAGKPV